MVVAVAVTPIGFRLQAARFLKAATEVKDFRPVFRRAVSNVIIPEIRANFATQGHGAWAPLAEVTKQRKKGPGMLIETGALEAAATDPSNWTQSRLSTQLKVPSSVGYGQVHVEGTGNIPQRDFTAMSEGTVDAIGEVFNKWLGDIL